MTLSGRLSSASRLFVGHPSSALRLVVIVLFVVAQARSSPGLDHLPVAVVTAGIALAMAAAIIPSVRLVALYVMVALALVLDHIAFGGGSVLALLYGVSVASARYPLRQSLPLAGLALTGLLVSGLLAGDAERDLSLGFSTCVIFLTSYAVRQRRETRAAEDREAVLAERARIARELHDVLAHSLSAQIIHLEGAKLLLRASRPEEALERVEHARELAKSGLEEARLAVSALREDLPSLPAALSSLAGEFRAATGAACSVEVSGVERRMAGEAQLALLRTAQEALTNARRHAPGAEVTVQLSYGPTSTSLTVTNPLQETVSSTGRGYGLLGMRERVEGLGGSTAAGPVDGRFQVRVTVPT
ncbi:sensor histidine kinase [Nonomuraea sp. NPDC050556]|uniref:sensor histidine kinase n=1 Tax=Nonomuraea sp. NPDC050556 TaxID=3364369 RepID=UPI0037B451D3